MEASGVRQADTRSSASIRRAVRREARQQFPKGRNPRIHRAEAYLPYGVVGFHDSLQPECSLVLTPEAELARLRWTDSPAAKSPVEPLAEAPDFGSEPQFRQTGPATLDRLRQSWWKVLPGYSVSTAVLLPISGKRILVRNYHPDRTMQPMP